MTVKPILVLAVGNESRGDDALGPLLARRINRWLQDTNAPQTTHLSDKIEVIEEYQLQIENALDIQRRQLVLFIDAGQYTALPFLFKEAVASQSIAHTTHSQSPESLLGLFVRVYATQPPPSFILCLAGRYFELGAPPSTEALSSLALAFSFCQTLLENPSYPLWQKQAQQILMGEILHA